MNFHYMRDDATVTHFYGGEANDFPTEQVAHACRRQQAMFVQKINTNLDLSGDFFFIFVAGAKGMTRVHAVRYS